MCIHLTEEQLEIANHSLPGHARVLAGPGTGKSTTAVALAERLLSADEHHGLRFLTFTRAATKELENKLASSVTDQVVRPSTVHSFAISVLLQNPGCASYPLPLRISDAFEFALIRKDLAKRTGVGVDKLDDLVAEMSSKWESLDPEERPGITIEERARFIGAWTGHRRVFGYTMLQELPDLCRGVLRDYPDARGVDYDLLIVDEYQDLNACDLELLRRIAERGASVMAMGDDDQSIYSNRKAHPAGIRNFLREYESSTDYQLSNCLRSTRSIVSWAQFLIQGDTTRNPRLPLRCLPEAEEGIAVLLNFPGEISEARGIADIVEWLIENEGIPPKEILILSRTDRFGLFTREVCEELKRRNIPISDATSVRRVLEDRTNRLLLSVLRLLINPTDSLAWWSLLAVTRGVGDTFVDHIFEQAIASNNTFGQTLILLADEDFPNGPRSSSNRARQLIVDIRNVVANVIVPDPSEDIHWGRWIKEGSTSGNLPECSDDFKSLLSGLDQIPDIGESLDRFLSQIQPFGEDLVKAQSEGVRFMTMMGSKGLTVSATIIMGVENDVIPRVNCDMSEERRLLYVAMTRSRKYLFLTWVNRRRGPAARSGNVNIGNRQHCDFLRGGPVESQNGEHFIRQITH